MKDQTGFMLPLSLFGILIVMSTVLLALQPIKTSWRLLEDYQNYLAFQQPRQTQKFVFDDIESAECTPAVCVLEGMADKPFPLSITSILPELSPHVCTTVETNRIFEASDLYHPYTCSGSIILSEPTLIIGNLNAANLQVRGSAQEIVIDGYLKGTLSLSGTGPFKIITAGQVELVNITATQDTTLILISATGAVVVIGVDSHINLHITGKQGATVPAGYPYSPVTESQQRRFKRLIFYREPLTIKNS